MGDFERQGNDPPQHLGIAAGRSFVATPAGVITFLIRRYGSVFVPQIFEKRYKRQRNILAAAGVITVWHSSARAAGRAVIDGIIQTN